MNKISHRVKIGKPRRGGLVKLLALGILVVGVSSSTSSVKADMLYGNPVSPSYRFAAQFENSNPERGWVWDETWQIGPQTVQGGNMTTGQDLWFFCTQMNVAISDAFKDQAVGQQYNATTLSDASMSGVQKDALQSLFNHTYAVLLDAQDAYAVATGSARTQAADFLALLSMSLQFTVWEIMHESESGNWDLTTGNYLVYDPFSYHTSNNRPSADQMYGDILDLTSSWFDSINTGIWTGLYEEEHLFELTHFTAVGGPSQPLVAVTGTYYSSDDGENAVPEPATLALLGLGFAGLGLARIRRKK